MNIREKIEEAIAGARMRSARIAKLMLVEDDYRELCKTYGFYKVDTITDPFGNQVEVELWKPELYELDPSIPTQSWMGEAMFMSTEGDWYPGKGLLRQVNIPRFFTLDPLAEVFPEGKAVLKDNEYWADEMKKCREDIFYYLERYARKKLPDGTSRAFTPEEVARMKEIAGVYGMKP